MTVKGLIAVCVVLGIALVTALGVGIPTYKVWIAEQEGKAILAKATYSRQAQVEDARAKQESATYLTEAATSIQGSLTPEYLEYLRIQMMEEVGRENPRAMFFQGQGLVVAPAIGDQ